MWSLDIRENISIKNALTPWPNPDEPCFASPFWTQIFLIYTCDSILVVYCLYGYKYSPVLLETWYSDDEAQRWLYGVSGRVAYTVFVR